MNHEKQAMLFSPMTLEIAAGTVGGAAQLCVGHPFDTTKVMLQKDRNGATAVSLARRVVERHGLQGLYAGITAPLPFVVAMTAALFSANAGLRNVISRRKADPIQELSLKEIALAGAGAGGVCSLLLCPIELVKCRMQGNPKKYPSAIEATRNIYNAGGLKYFARGGLSTLLREVPGTAIYFGCYEGYIRWARRKRSSVGPDGMIVEAKNTVGEQMMGGGIAGILFWSAVYPVDYVKTMLQTDSISQPKYAGFLDCVRKTAKKHGPAALFRGIGPALARSFPACAVTFVAYERAKLALENWVKN